MTQEFSTNLAEGGREQTIHDVSVVSSQNVTFNQTQIIQISVEEVKTRKFIITSPYKGLKKFESEDKDRFFGRDQFLTGLVNELDQTNFVLLLGGSGSGKSSAIRAGLIPWLVERQGSHLVNLVFTPDRDPFESLYASLLGKHKQSEAQMARMAKEDTLTQVVRSLKQQDAYWFILIDQFEELFTTTEPSKRDIFIRSLLQLVQALNKAGNRSVKIMATMRADFLDRLSPYPDLIAVTDKHRPMIAEMQLDELRLAIEQPAAHHGVVFEGGLVKEIIDDVRGEAGYLPLLEYTLNLLWETEVQCQSIEDRTLNISNYRKLGGVRGALQQHVDSIYSGLSELEKLAAQKIFLKLVGIGEDEESGTEWKPVRRRANRSEFSEPLEQKALTQLIDQNLLVSNRVTDSQGSTIEIAHEALLTSWVTLNTWIKENRNAIALRNRLNDDVAQWKKTKSHEDLWSGSKLEKILELRQDQTFDRVLGGLSQEAHQFLDASQSQRDRIHQEKLRRTQLAAIAAIVVACLLGGMAAITFYQLQQTQRQRAEQLAAVGTSLLLSAKPTEGLINTIAAMGLSQSAIVKFPNRSVPRSVRDALFNAILYSREQNILWHGSRVLAVAFSHDGQRIVSSGDDGTIRLWNRDGNPIGKPFGEKGAEIRSIAFSPDGKYIVSGGLGGSIRLWDLQGNRLPILFRGHTSLVFAVAFSPDGKKILSGSADGTVRLWDLQGNQIGKPFQGHQGTVYSVAFSPDGQRIVSGGADGTIRLWDLQDNQIGKPFEDKGTVYSVAFDPAKGQDFISAGSDRTIRIWNTQRIEWITSYKAFEGHELEIFSVAFSPDGQQIVSGSGDGTIRLWNLSGEEIPPPFQGHAGWVTSVALSPDGKNIVSGSGDGTLRLWDLQKINDQKYSSWEAGLQIACDRLRYHSILRNPKSDIAREAQRTCERYVWH